MVTGHGKHARKPPRAATICVTISFAVAFAAVAAAVLMRVADSGAAAPHADQPTTAPAAGDGQPVTQVGRLIAVSPNSLTAQGLDGVARTYIVDAQTNKITTTGSQMGDAASTFAVNDEVSIVGVTRDGADVATVIAARDAAQLNGPPMDYALP
jgi:hypothetical protein